MRALIIFGEFMRILIGLILTVSVSFACDQPYAEVVGIKIGCPLENKDNYHEEILFERGGEGRKETISLKVYVDITDPEVSHIERTKIIAINDQVEHLEITVADPSANIADLDTKIGEHIQGNYCEVLYLTGENYKEFCSQPERNIYVWPSSVRDVIYDARIEYMMNGYLLRISSNKYQVLTAGIQAERKKEQEIMLKDILDERGVKMP